MEDPRISRESREMSESSFIVNGREHGVLGLDAHRREASAFTDLTAHRDTRDLDSTHRTEGRCQGANLDHPNSGEVLHSSCECSEAKAQVGVDFVERQTRALGSQWSTVSSIDPFIAPVRIEIRASNGGNNWAVRIEKHKHHWLRGFRDKYKWGPAGSFTNEGLVYEFP